MPEYQRKLVVVGAEQWFRLGDVEGICLIFPPGSLKHKRVEKRICQKCGHPINNHGQIIGNSLLDVSLSICPGDWIVNKQEIFTSKEFEQVFEKVEQNA